MPYNPRKAAQTIAYFASKNESRKIKVLKAIKLVYLADRESIARFGFPIQDEIRVSMPHGPVNSTTLSYINGEHEAEDSGWADFLSDRDNFEVMAQVASPEDFDELSEADIICLDHVWNTFGDMNQWEIRDWTHDRANLPEWEDPKGSSLPIPLERILLALGIENHVEAANQIRSVEHAETVLRQLKAS
jgi:uncharacterized phage-associated protein